MTKSFGPPGAQEQFHHNIVRIYTNYDHNELSDFWLLEDIISTFLSKTEFKDCIHVIWGEGVHRIQYLKRVAAKRNENHYNTGCHRKD